jgi:hypothetical protein
MKFTDLVPKGIIAGTSGEDAISLLTADHEKVQQLFRQFAAVKGRNFLSGCARRDRRRANHERGAG